MQNYSSIIIIVLSISLLFNYLSLLSKKTAIQIVNEMGIGYNFGNVFNCCNNIEDEDININEIKLYDTILPTKKEINKIKKYGFKTIRFQVIYKNFESENDSQEWISGIKEVVDWIINYNLYCILSIHHNLEFWKNEDISPKVKYSKLWEFIANIFIDYDERLIFESMSEIDTLYISLVNSTQIFVDAIRNSGGSNKERLLIISEMFTELEINNYYEYKMPKDPSNKTAVSMHYFFPSITLEDFDNIIPMDWYDREGYPYYSIPMSKWGSDNDYKELMNRFQLLKRIFLDNKIPIIIGEAGIITEFNNNVKSFGEFIYALFSISMEFNGIMSCLWDTPVKIGENSYYYNREIDKWNDEIIRDNIQKISKGKFVKSSEYYSMTNLENILPQYNEIFLNFGTKKVVKIYINAQLLGEIGKDFDLSIISSDKNDEWVLVEIKKENGKKQYDGTVKFTIDVSNEDFNELLFTFSNFGEEYFLINNATIEFEDNFSYFDYKSFKNDVLNNLVG